MADRKFRPAKDLRVPFGLRDGRMWSARNVPNGLACDCRCPSSDELLIAKNEGAVQRPHFAHHVDRSCQGAFESAVHRMAKQLICEHLILQLPAWTGTAEMPNPPIARDSAGNSHAGDTVNLPAILVDLRAARLEVPQEDYRPDVLAEDVDGELLVEVRVTHAVGDSKLRNVQSDGRRMLEIDLSSITSEEAESPELFADLVLRNTNNRIWISHPVASDLWRWSRESLKARLAQIEAQIQATKAEQERARLEAQQREAERAKRRESVRQKLREPFLDELAQLPVRTAQGAIQAKYASMLDRDQEPAERLLARIPALIASTLRRPRGAAWAYEAHYLLWHSAAYLHFFEGKPTGHVVLQREIGRWLRTTYGVDPVLWKLFRGQWLARQDARNAGYKKFKLAAWFFSDEENRLIPDFYAPIDGFVGCLVSCGVISISSGQSKELTLRENPVQSRSIVDFRLDAQSIAPASQPSDVARSSARLDADNDPLLGKRIWHAQLGVGVVRKRLSKSSPTYDAWFNGARWRKVWLGNPSDGSWRVLDDEQT